MVLPFRIIRDVCDFILGLPSQGGFVVAFEGDFTATSYGFQ